MLEKIFSTSGIINEHRTGPLGKYSDVFAKWLFDAGYSKPDLRRRMGVVSDLNRWLRARALKLENLTPKRIACFYRYRARRADFYGSGNHATLEQLLSILRAEHAIPAAPLARVGRKEVIDESLSGFVKYLKEEKGFSEAALNRYRLSARHFLAWRFRARRIVLQNLSADDIGAFIAYYRNRYSQKNVQVIASVLRAYLRFLFLQGILGSDLSGAITAIPHRRGRQLPVFLEPQEVTRLLRCARRPTAVGRRNYAMLLVMLRLGLRASEVLNLTLDDVDWKQGTLTVRGKGKTHSVLPLPHEVGAALVHYIRKGRPTCHATRKLFMRTRAPYGSLHHSSSVGTVVRRALIVAGLRPSQMGAHLLRYTAATQSLRRGATLPEVRDLLRHRSIDTTTLYAKVDLRRLNRLVVCWPAA